MSNIVKKIMNAGVEYDVPAGISGNTYTEGTGIDITNNVISADMTTAVYDNTTSGATATNMQDAMDEVFQSVSNGKELIADAITDKGVSTSATDSFQTMASNISSLDIATEAQIAAYNMLVSWNWNLVWNTSINYWTNSTPVNASSSFWYTQDEKIFYFIWAKQDSSSDYNRNSWRLYMFNKDWTFDYIEVDIRHNKNNRDYPFSSIAVYQKTWDDNLYFWYVYGSYTYTWYNAYNAYCKYNVVTKELEEIQLTELWRREGDSSSSATWRDWIVVTQLSSWTVTFPYTINVDYTLSTYTWVFVTTQRIP